ncbi:MAG: serine/threonine protein kinase [Acidobacteriota bacterium]|nr:MAG: serine/threonine protein kinase [Acidobacteriota bacterium]
MTAERNHFLELAAAVVDREPVAWAAAAAAADSEQQRALIRQLQQIARIAQVHQQLPSLEGGRDRAVSPTSPAKDEGLMSLGGYRLLERIGEGAMAVVYKAERQAPEPAIVAIKALKHELDFDEVKRRFDTVRSALERVDHPGIASIFELGLSPQARPFLVCEYVEGWPITVYAARHELPVGARLGLFAELCEAVQAGHDAGLVHRSIKPSNVLVEQRGKGRAPRILDFGTVTITAQRLTEWVLLARFGRPIAAPSYLAPEETDLSEKSIAPTTDVYSLGALLFELLTGRAFSKPREGHERRLTEARRMIHEEQPPSVMATLGRPDRAIPRRSTERDHAALDELLRTALQKNPADRFRSAAALRDAVANIVVQVGD